MKAVVEKNKTNNPRVFERVGYLNDLALKRKATRVIKELSKEKIRVAVDFLDYLKEKEEMEAILEILSNRELMTQIEEAEKTIKEKNIEEFITWETVKRNV